jgi:hypothetical protein
MKLACIGGFLLAGILSAQTNATSFELASIRPQLVRAFDSLEAEGLLVALGTPDQRTAPILSRSYFRGLRRPA